MKTAVKKVRIALAFGTLLCALCASADAPKYYMNADDTNSGDAFVNAKWWNDEGGTPGVPGALPDANGDFYVVGHKISTTNEMLGATGPINFNSLHIGKVNGLTSFFHVRVSDKSILKVLGEGLYLHNGQMPLQWHPITIDGIVTVDALDAYPFLIYSAYSSTTLNIPATLHAGEEANLQFRAIHNNLANDKEKDTLHVKLLGDYSDYRGRMIVGADNDTVARFVQLELLNGDFPGSLVVKTNGEISVGSDDVKVGSCVFEDGSAIVARGGCLVVTNDFQAEGTVGVSLAGCDTPNVENPRAAIISVPAGVSISSGNFRVVETAASLSCKAVSFTVERDENGGSTLYASFERSSVYVSPNGSDDDTGADRDHAFATLAHAVSVLDDGVIYALPGTYASGVCDLGDACTHSRVHIPSKVVLKSTEGAEQTFIVGDAGVAPQGDATARAGATRCARLDSGAVLQGFTLTGGYVYNNDKDDTSLKYEQTGAGVIGEVGSVVLDCRLYENTAVCGGAAQGGVYVRCWFGTNTVVKSVPDVYGYRIATYCFDCVFSSEKAPYNHVGNNVNLYNCTFPSSSQGGPVSGCKMYNCLIRVESYLPGGQNEYRNCVLAMEPYGGASVFENCIVASLDDEIDSECRLGAGSHSVDFGNWEFYLAGWDAAGIPRQMLGRDYNGGQRVYNVQVDVGALEYDWRPRFGTELGKRFEVTFASSSVTTNAEGGLVLSEGAVAGKMSRDGRYAVYFDVSCGTLAVYVNGVLAGKSSDADKPFVRFSVDDSEDEVRFAFAPDSETTGSAVLKRIQNALGFVVTFK